MHRSRSHPAVIRVYDEAGNVIEAHEHTTSRKVTETFLCPLLEACKVTAMRPSETEQTKLSHKEWRDQFSPNPKAKAETGITSLSARSASLATMLTLSLVTEPPARWQ